VPLFGKLRKDVLVEYLFDSWSLVAILLSAFVIGWAAETAQTFIPRALALTILAWLQTLPEFAVEATIAWNQQTDLMIANLTGSLRLLVGLGWPMIFFVHFFYQGFRSRKWVDRIDLDKHDSWSVLFLFLSILYFLVVLYKGSLTCADSVVLTLIYVAYLVIISRLPVEEGEDPEDLPWIGKKIVKLSPVPRVSAVVFLFVAGGGALYLSAHPFVETLQKWSLHFGISTFVFVQWVAPFLSEFPEKVTAFNWARQKGKAPMAVMNMVSSNINQWTLLAAMIPVVFSISLGRLAPIPLDHMHWMELALTVAQSALAGLFLLDLRFTLLESSAIFILWLVQFVHAPLRDAITVVYVVWFLAALLYFVYRYFRQGYVPRSVAYLAAALTRQTKG
jgi:cation:H+ antiporter